ncbi:hypothetical protein C8J57DRAFT_1650662 [Mycena rebaudengoi]|nr:hypothetical protein C8J57DRAFT_1650662 [Mycena rebaudengoi]
MVFKTYGGMFSHSNHHHENVSGTSSRPTCPVHSAGFTAHQQTLESILDSALATISLLQDATTDQISYTPRTIAVLQAISVAYWPTAPPPPLRATPELTPAPPLSLAVPPPLPTTATYAQATASVTPIIPLSSPSTALADNHHPTPRVILRFDQFPRISPTQADTFMLYRAISGVLPKRQISAVNWTRNGNLAIHAAAGFRDVRHIIRQDDEIWKAIKPLLSSTVFQYPPSRKLESFRQLIVEDSLMENPITGEVKGLSVLCRKEDFANKSSLSVKISLSSATDALWLIRNGGSFCGTQCRVSRYMAKQRLSSPNVSLDLV